MCKTPSKLYVLPDEFAFPFDMTTTPFTLANQGCARRFTKAQLIALVDASAAATAGTVQVSVSLSEGFHSCGAF